VRSLRDLSCCLIAHRSTIAQVDVRLTCDDASLQLPMRNVLVRCHVAGSRDKSCRRRRDVPVAVLIGCDDAERGDGSHRRCSPLHQAGSATSIPAARDSSRPTEGQSGPSVNASGPRSTRARLGHH
jgi:hypothetical protein